MPKPKKWAVVKITKRSIGVVFSNRKNPERLERPRYAIVDVLSVLKKMGYEIEVHRA